MFFAPTREQTGLFLVLLAAVGFASKSIFVKLAYQYEGVDAVTILALRMGFALVMLGVITLFQHFRRIKATPLSGKEWLWVIGLGLMGYYVSSLLNFWGLFYITASLERMIIYLYPTMVVLLSAVIFRKPISLPMWGALILSYVGMGLIFVEELGGSQMDVWTGGLLEVGAALTYALYLMGTARMMKTIDALRFTSLVLLVCSSALWVHFFATHSPADLLVPLPVLACGAALGVFSTLLPIYALAAGIARIGASRASLASMAGPLITLLLGAIFLGERLSLVQMGGVVLIIAGVWMTGRMKGA